MTVTNKIKSDLLCPGARPRVYAVQDDICTRVVEVSLYAGGIPWDAAGGRAAIGYKKSDGTIGLSDTLPDGSHAATVSANKVTITLAVQMLTVPGPVEALVTLVKDADGSQISTFGFDVIVEKNPAAGATKSEDYINFIDQSFHEAIARANSAADRAESIYNDFEKALESKAPSGFGLGFSELTTENVDNVAAPGWYHWNTTSSFGNVSADYWYMHVTAYGNGSTACTQEMWPVKSGSNCKVYRHKRGGTWGSPEVENPPFEPEVEYRTTDRLNGKAVYKKVDASGVMHYRLDGDTVWHPYRELVGAASDQFGLGASKRITAAMVDSTTAPGFYDIAETMTINNITANYWYMDVSAYGTGTSHCTQIMRPVSKSGCRLERNKRSGEWDGWGCDNPPLETGVEYRTTELCVGKPVYVKKISFGSLPASSYISVSTGIVGKLVAITGLFYDGSGSVEPYPVLGTNGVKGLCWVSNDCSKLYVQANEDCSAYTGEFVLKYTKD